MLSHSFFCRVLGVAMWLAASGLYQLSQSVASEPVPVKTALVKPTQEKPAEDAPATSATTTITPGSEKAGTGTAGNKVPEAEVKPLKIAHLKISGALTEGAPLEGLFGETSETLFTLIARLDKAAADKEIQTVVLEFGDLALGRGKIYELRSAIARIRAAGKDVWAYLDSADTTAYLLASACDKIVMPEPAMLMIPGVRAEVWFYKEMLSKIDVEPEVVRIGEFKSAGEPYTRKDMSPEFKKEMDELLDDVYSQIVSTIAESRKIPADKVRELIDTAVFTSEKAKSAGLLDEVQYESGLYDVIKKSHNVTSAKLTRNYGRKKTDADLSGLNGIITLMNALSGQTPASRKSSAPKVGILYASGMISTGSSQNSPLSGEVLGSETFIKAVRQLRDDDTVKAVVLRIDSPGGSALASDLMWHELELLKAKKPLVASMSDVAGSGGYYIAMGTQKIYAAPGTVTGSIGVVGGKVALEKLYNKLGINVVVLERGKNSGVLSTTTGFTESQREATRLLMNEIYEQFTSKAAAGRKMEVAQLEKLARGRIYSGNRALEIGLVDEIGTLEDAIKGAIALAKIENPAKLERLELPKPGSPLESLLGPMGAESRMEARLEQRLKDLIPTALQPALQDELLMRMLANQPVLTVMPYRLELK
ncbi:signal peptide peptidase SppA, 36K type [Planctopirus limnophila DSM 3776]|uniref:Signal peptide peptidase SppA, 36K type n=1 Tax=Planctopirus limnophila (strain ATCC 43296 / DSM 3776 / IFAM 1008 / Mu 290) TaxID=521674 RepID=D5SVG6_PLAL2|nr:signal peptide peptidase SppA [Planctopirus limnophila]ADG67236.1 signal peptide peptidase SppA, 36K type [Planctopirus limnophila DSM 3776]